MRRVLIYFLIAGCVSLAAQEKKFEFERISTLDGLSQNNVLSIYKDSRGYVWFGTYDGLNMYNGYEFKVFRATDKINPLTSNFVQTISEDIYGNIWSGSFNNGINRLNITTGEVLQLKNTEDNPNMITSNACKWLIGDSKGRTWLGTNDGLNIITQNGDGTVNIQQIKPDMNDPQSMFTSYVQSIYEDTQHRIWISTDENLDLMIMDKNGNPQNKFHHIATDTNITDLRDINETSEGYLFSTSVGAMLLRFNEEFPEESELIPLENHTSFNLTTDLDGNLWTCGSDGLFYFEHNPDEEIPYVLKSHIKEGESEFELSNQFVRSMHFDDAGILWLGTNGGGICKYNTRKTKFRHYRKTSTEGSIGHNKIWFFLEDKQKNLWVSTEGDGINFMPANQRGNYESGFTQSVRVNDVGGQNYTFEILELSDDNTERLWAGVGYNNKLVEVTKQPNGAYLARQLFPQMTNQVMVLEKDEYGNIWMGTYEGGIYKYVYKDEGNVLINYTAQNSNCPTNIIRNFKEDSKGRLWIGTDKGLLLLTPEQKEADSLEFTIFMHDKADPKSLSHNYTVPIIEDSNGVIWIGTFGGGLNRYHEGTTLTNGTFTAIRKDDGLSSDNIYGLVEDDLGSLWITTNNGLSRLNKSRTYIRNFDVHDGLQHMAFTDLSCQKMSDGEILIGGVKGFNAFYPNEITEDTIPPILVLTELSIMNSTVKANVQFNNRVILKKTLNETRIIELEYAENNFTITFAGLHYTLPSKNQYRYILEGVDNDWVYATADSRFARYTNVSAGRYTFKLLASNCYGVWETEPKEVTIIINPPFYQTWWFRILVFLTLSGIIYIFYRRRMNKVKREQEALQAKIDESMVELDKSKKEVEQAKAEIEEHKDQIRIKELEEREMRYFNTGLAKFSDIIGQHDELGKLCHAIIQELVDYVGSQIGILYVITEDLESPALQVQGSYGADTNLIDNSSILVGEGNVGTCYFTGQTINLDDVPDDYLRISSGLGEVKPKFVSFVPLIQNEDKIGVIEVAAFSKIENFKIEFIKKLGENITSTILLMRVIGKNKEIISEAQSQAEELKAQEEEMRQNIEELMTTQEENTRLKEQMEEKVKMLEESISEKIRENEELRRKLKGKK